MRRNLETKKERPLDQPTNPLDAIDEIGFSKDRDPGGLGPLSDIDPGSMGQLSDEDLKKINRYLDEQVKKEQQKQQKQQKQQEQPMEELERLLGIKFGSEDFSVFKTDLEIERELKEIDEVFRSISEELQNI